MIMSGDFVQSGRSRCVLTNTPEPRMALLGGADAVLELPSCRSCGSAEYFAKEAVGDTGRSGLRGSSLFWQ